MNKVKWSEEEAVALYDLYFRYGGTYAVPEYELQKLTNLYTIRAKVLALSFDIKFRNNSGLKMQLACIHYVVTNGTEGLSNVSKLFYDVYETYKKRPDKFNAILDEFNRKYDVVPKESQKSH